MGAPFQEYWRRAILPLIGLAMAAYYLLVFFPLSQKAKDLDKPVNASWRKLADGLGRTNATSLDFRQITNQLDETRQALAMLSGAEQKTIARLRPGAELQSRMSAPFRLVDYQNELSQHAEETSRQARLRKIELTPLLFEGFPQHRMEITEPSLLWGALQMTEDVVDTAMACGVTAIYSLETPVTFTNTPGIEPGLRWVEVPILMEFAGSATAVSQTLQSLPLRPEELKEAGLPVTSEEKTVLFIDRLLIRRQDPEKVDHIRVWLKAVGFILRE